MTQTRLDELMTARADQLGLKWHQIAEQAGISRDTLHRVRTGTDTVRSLTKAAIERVLRWAPGSIDNIVNGGEPIETMSPEQAQQAATDEIILALWSQLPRPQRARLLARLAVIQADDENDAMTTGR